LGLLLLYSAFCEEEKRKKRKGRKIILENEMLKPWADDLYLHFTSSGNMEREGGGGDF